MSSSPLRYWTYDPPSTSGSPSPSPFLRFARIPELLDLLLDELPRNSLAKLARTCRLLFEPSAKALWSTHDALLVQLLQLLPSAVQVLQIPGTEEDGLEERRTGFPKKADLQRIQRYGKFIRSLELHGETEPGVIANVQMLHNVAIDSPVLPILTTLSILDTPDNIALAQLLLSPSVRSLFLYPHDIDGPPVGRVGSLLDWLPDRCPNLEHLCFHWNSAWNEVDNAYLSHALRRLPHLHTVKLYGIVSSDPDLLVAPVLDLPHLQHLDISLYDSYENESSKPSLYRAIGDKSFRALQHLRCSSSLTLCNVMVERCHQLDHLETYSHELSGIDDLAGLVETLRSITTLKRLTLLFDRCTVGPGKTVWRCLQPLSAVPLRSFTFSVNEEEGLARDFNQVFELVSSWHRLKTLHLQLPWSRKFEEQELPSLSTLVFVLKHCPELQTLYLDELWPGSSREESWDICHCNLTRLTLGGSGTPTSALTQFLCLVCPNVIVHGNIPNLEAMNEQLNLVRFVRQAERRRKICPLS